jgi:diguanylate cyclase (GGDEF)-like protein/PAS domain S-box-containing protein
MKLKYKLTFSIVLLGSVLISIGGYVYYSANKASIIKEAVNNNKKNAAFMSTTIEHNLLELVRLTKTMASTDDIKESLLESNKDFSALNETDRNNYIDSLNDKWLNNDDINDTFIKNRIDNGVGAFLVAQKKASPNVYGEIFLTNKYGVMISTTGKLTSLAHYNKYWWQEAFNDGKGIVYLDDSGYDKSVKDYVLGVVVPVYDDFGKIIGVLKSNYNIAHLFGDTVDSFHDLNSIGESFIVRSSGLIVDARNFKTLSRSTPDEIRPYLEKKVAVDKEITIDGKHFFLTIKPIDLTYKSDSLLFGGKDESIDNQKGNLGKEGWSVVHVVEKKVVLKPLRDTLETFFFMGFGMLILLGIAALCIGESLSKPFRKLNDYINEVGKGKLIKKDMKINDDEIGDLTVSFDKLIDNLNSTLTSKEQLEAEKNIAQKYLKELKLSGDVFKNSIENAPIPIMIHAEDGTVLNISKKWTELTHYTKEDIPTTFDWVQKAYGKDKDEVIKFLQNLYKFKKTQHVRKSIITNKGGKKLTWDFKSGYIGDLPDGRALAISIARDITEQITKDKEIEFLSYHDQLTGLYNRRFFEERLKRLDNPRNLPLSIVMGDVNGLKLTNDAFGHLAGDKSIKIIGNAIAKSIRGNDIATRWGGDEFVILLPNTKIDEAELLIKRIQQTIKEIPFEYGNLSISFGVDTKIEEQEELKKVFVVAEKLMYKNKLANSDSIHRETIETIMDTLFKKSSKIKEHSIRVSELSGFVAEKMGLSKVSVDNIKKMGLVHDIGLVSIDMDILDKSGPLTEAERLIIQQHPVSGSKLLNSSHEYSKLLTGVLNHHEQVDGKGYPNGISADQISIESKIIAVVDAFDIMTALDVISSQRPSNERALSIEEAIIELQKYSGTKFDKKVVDVFINKVLKEKLV